MFLQVQPLPVVGLQSMLHLPSANGSASSARVCLAIPQTLGQTGHRQVNKSELTQPQAPSLITHFPAATRCCTCHKDPFLAMLCEQHAWWAAT